MNKITDKDQRRELVDGLMKGIESEFSGVDIWLSYDKFTDSVVLSKIVIDKKLRGKGIGSAVMKRITDFADSNGMKVVLTPSSDFGGSVGRLKRFYKGFGFRNYRGYEHRETMERDPVMKLYEILFEQAEDIIDIVGYHRNNNSEFSKSDITMEPRITRQSKGGVGNVGFYITMPRMKVDSVEDLPSRIETPMDIGKHYGEHLYEISVSIPREQILLNNNTIGSTRISSDDLAKINKKFIYVPRGFPTAEGIVLDPSIVRSVKKVEEQ